MLTQYQIYSIDGKDFQFTLSDNDYVCLLGVVDSTAYTVVVEYKALDSFRGRVRLDTINLSFEENPLLDSGYMYCLEYDNAVRTLEECLSYLYNKWLEIEQSQS